ncbi:MAG: acyl-CoA dehydrogenase family protein [Chloroflexota bacterium]|nr:acyl-CoA dehydrogenase family protein [Dehalococcoidia bacterium]MDW8253481.1 acyl-CoA dehydrogenase family protein [Chloroflexota bacterium]
MAEHTLFATARQLAADFAGRAAQHDQAGSFPYENLVALRRAGFYRLTLPAHFGGLGADLATAAGVVRILGGGDASTALILTQHLAVTGAFAWLGSERCRRFLREEVAADRFVGLFAGAPEFEGRAPTVAVRDVGGWRLFGRKGFGTGCLIADWAVVSAVTAAGSERESLSCLVRLDAPGFSILETWDTVGMRATASHDLLFDGCFVADDDVVARSPEHDFGPRPGGGNLATGFFCYGVTLFAALYLGIADAALASLHDLLSSRTPVGRQERLIDAPATQAAFAEIALLHRSASAMLEWNAHRHRDPAAWTADTFPDLVATKDIVTRTAVEIVQRCVQLAGAAALWRRLPLERYLRDVQGGPLHPLNHGATVALLGSLAAAVVPPRERE